jgi:ribosomal protein S18 acetylase RimI-like enzyme
LRRASAADLEDLLALETRCFSEGDGLFHRRQLHYLLKSPHCAWFIAGHFEGAVCVLVAANGRRRWGRLYSLAVDPQYRKQGVARRLLAAAFAWLREQGVTTVRAEVKSANGAARHLYADLGFTEEGVLPDYYGPGDPGIKLYRPL